LSQLLCVRNEIQHSVILLLAGISHATVTERSVEALGETIAPLIAQSNQSARQSAAKTEHVITYIGTVVM
jgi:hypothetical protein